MTDDKIPFVTFYAENNISPVSQDISDLKKHFRRREALYRHLGLPPALLRGKRILEIGPGSGFNALFTLNCAPGRYLLIDGNPVGAQETSGRLKAFAAQGAIDTDMEVRLTLLENFETSERFDLVLCEGMLPWQIDPPGLFRRLMSYCAPGGLVVVTCIDALSSLSDMLRRVMGLAVVDVSLPLSEQAETLEPFFAPHFANLPGMSRPLPDWIYDNVLQPCYGSLFSISDAIDAAADVADVYGASPHFFTDWRWYKDIHEVRSGVNELMKRLYWENAHNFLDYEAVFPSGSAENNRRLMAMGDKLFTEINEFQRNRDLGLLEDMAAAVESLAEGLGWPDKAKIFARTAARVRDAARMLKEIRTAARPREVAAGEFAFLFGRGQQYVSFIVKA